MYSPELVTLPCCGSSQVTPVLLFLCRTFLPVAAHFGKLTDCLKSALSVDADPPERLSQHRLCFCRREIRPLHFSEETLDLMTKNTKQHALQQSPLHMIHRASQAGEDLLQSDPKAIELTARQFVVLEHLAVNEGASQRMLVDTTGIDRSTMADIVRRLVAKGFIKRARSKLDARAYEVVLTPKGRAALKSARPVIRRVESKLLEVLSQRQASDFIACLNLIATSLNGAAEPAKASAVKRAARGRVRAK